MLIVIEGSDGSGKTSVAEELARRLKAEAMAFPNDAGVTGPIIRDYLRKNWYIPVYGTAQVSKHYSALAFQALQVVNRLEFMPKLMDASLNEPEGPRVIVARYWQSGWVYGGLDGLDRAWLERVHEMMAEPDLSLLLDITPEEAMRRRAARDGDLAPELYEGKLDFTTKVVESYRELWKQHEGNGRWDVIDAMRPFQQVVDNCYERILESVEESDV
jgi:dTMP kinase